MRKELRMFPGKHTDFSLILDFFSIGYILSLSLIHIFSLPLKYMHSPVETLDLDDLEHSAALLAAFVQDLSLIHI